MASSQRAPYPRLNVDSLVGALDEMVPLPTAETMQRKPGKILLSIRMGEATVNWQSSVEEIETAYRRIEKARRMPPTDKMSDEAVKQMHRNFIIHHIKKNEHMVQSTATVVAALAMWYMWLKKEQAGYARFWNTGELARLIMIIEEGANDFYQFKWGIDLKDKLPELDRVDIFTPYRRK